MDVANKLNFIYLVITFLIKYVAVVVNLKLRKTPELN